MSAPIKKRAGTEPAGPGVHKIPRLAPTKNLECEEEAIEITVDLHSRFNAYPETLRNHVEARHAAEVDEIMKCFKMGRIISPKAKYHIVRGSRVQGGDEKTDYKIVNIDTYQTANMANIAVLEQFLARAPSKKGAFIRATNAKLANPDFAELHSVHPGQMGWGFDKLGCLSLHLTVIENNKLKHTYVYVEQRTAVVPKVEIEDDECQIVENSQIKE
ncbi:hypothetical protein N0V94_006651 [Neodidymelliopsis sp. IMI 364377]|nr:hypothetical protein N0V94_006651 [Neodidymelliopsis sp. IMI 364377]